MKKFLLYSSIFTVVVLVLGILFVYGVFDISQRRSQLIGSLHGVTEMDMHNRVVEYVHDIGISTTEGWNQFNSLEPKSDLYSFKKAVTDTQKRKDDLLNYIENHTFSKNRKDIETAFSESYLPALEKWINVFSKVKAYFQEKPVTEESLSTFKGALNKAHQGFIEAHNSYTEVLNETRKY